MAPCEDASGRRPALHQLPESARRATVPTAAERTIRVVGAWLLRGPAFIADLFKLSVEEVLVAIRYIEEHKQELMPEYQEMLDAAARGNPPHIRAILAENHKKVLALKRELEAKKRQEPAGETGDARAAG